MKIITNLFLLFVIIISSNLSAQDTIVFIDGKEVLAKIMTVSKSVRYKKHSNLDGPVYSVSADEIYKITYANGDEDIFNAKKIKKGKSRSVTRRNYLSIRGKDYYEGYRIISQEDFFDKLQSVPNAYENYVKGKKVLKGGLVTSGIGMLGFIISASGNVKRNTTSPFTTSLRTASSAPTGIIFSGVIFTTGLVIISVGSKKMRDGLKLYNISMSKDLSLNLNENGIGLVVKF